jgi:hypothetical protein
MMACMLTLSDVAIICLELSHLIVDYRFHELTPSGRFSYGTVVINVSWVACVTKEISPTAGRMPLSKLTVKKKDIGYNNSSQQLIKKSRSMPSKTPLILCYTEFCQSLAMMIIFTLLQG